MPFYPYSSDDGFAVIDYTAVDSRLGDWSDIAAFQQDFGLMFDFVLNHISVRSEWFQGFLAGDPQYKEFFIALAANTDVSQVRRPRTSPLLTPFATASGQRYVWTTFSEDQVDLNYAQPAALLAMIDVMLFYVQRGAQLIRLDAITYVWKRLGTECVHLPETHAIVRVLRAVLDYVAPGVQIITETNVPHHENIAYFGNGMSEAHGVYNFALPPLLLHTMQTADKTAFEAWAAAITVPSEQCFFFNFTASHDGIGLTPVKQILSQAQIKAMVDRVVAVGGMVSYKTTPHGPEPYELNTTFFDAIRAAGDSQHQAVQKFLVTQAIMLAFRGVPGIYLGSLLGITNWQAGVHVQGHNRAINRHKLILDDSQAALLDATTLQGAIFAGYRQLLAARRSQAAFAPQATMDIIDLHPQVVAIRRRAADGQTVLALHNITSHEVAVSLSLPGRDILTDSVIPAGQLKIPAYGISWLRENDSKKQDK